MNQVERWGVFEVTVNGPTDGNPFTEREFRGYFNKMCFCPAIHQR